MTALTRTGTVKKRFRATRGPRACVVDLIRRDEARQRARFYLDEVALATLRPSVGDRLACELYFDDDISSDDEIDMLGVLLRVEVATVHERGFVDVDAYAPLVEQTPDSVLLRRYPERLQWGDA